MKEAGKKLTAPDEGTLPALGLRQRKAAQTRIALTEALRTHLAESNLDEVSADILADEANVSRVTFFNYFPSKRDAVELLMATLLFRIQATIHRRELRGVEAIEHIFDAMGAEVADSPARMRRIFAVFALRPTRTLVEPLTLAERLLLEPSLDHDEFGFLDLGPLLIRLIEEAREDGLELQGSSYEFGHYLGSLLNGMGLTGHTSGDVDWRQLYRRHVRRALGLLGDESYQDPRPPRVPEKYRRRGPRQKRR